MAVRYQGKKMMMQVGAPTAGGFPIECATDEEMNAALEAATENSVGQLYKFTGETTETYEQGAIYIVEEVAE